MHTTETCASPLDHAASLLSIMGLYGPMRGPRTFSNKRANYGLSMLNKN